MAETENKKTRKKKKSRIKNPALRKFLLALRITLLLLLLVTLIGGIVFYFMYGQELLAMQQEARKAVQESTRQTFCSAETSVIYDSKGKEIADLKGERDVYYLTNDQIPDYVKMAFVSIEDKKFYTHSGVDYFAIARAAIQRVKKGKITQGGSTITQQLIRNVFISKEQTYERKIREMFYAQEMERKYSKEDILEFYINNVYFHNGYYGIEAASYGYFDKEVNQLTLSEIAFLCAIPNGPTKFNPLVNFDNTMTRRDLILKNMRDDGKISNEEYDNAIMQEIVLAVQKNKKQNYVETFAKSAAIKALMKSQGFVFQYKFANDAEKKEYDEEYNELHETCEGSLYTAGYRIYTSINMNKQSELQKAVNEQLSGFKDKADNGVYKMQGAAVCIDNKNGRVVAIVGGRKQNDITGYTLNRAFQSFRQPGSSIKPLVVYTPSFENGYTPESIVDDTYFNGGPHNSNGKYSGKIQVRAAVAASKNVIAWKLFEELTPKKGLSYILNMGFSNIVADDYYAASSLGGLTKGVSVLEMASGYSTIENEGYFRDPTCIVKITDARGNIIYKDRQVKKRIYTKDASHMMTSCMKDVITKGTAVGLGLNSTVSAAKTGTTNDKKDGWFCGFTSYYTTAVWVGYDTPQTVNDLYGSTYPGRIWHQYMEKIHENLEYSHLKDEYTKSQQEKVDKEEPEETDEPELTDEPVLTDEPEVTDEPEEWHETETEEPVITDEPVVETPSEEQQEEEEPVGMLLPYYRLLF